jgi:hypothetical protein
VADASREAVASPKEDRMSRKTLRLRAAAVVALMLVGFALPASADRYDPQKAGHPVRILAYALHPVGVMLDLLIFRPAHWIGSKEPLASFFGHERYTH